MLDYLGVPYIQSAGEAEAMCAFLNRNQASTKLLQLICDCLQGVVCCMCCFEMSLVVLNSLVKDGLNI